MPTGEHFATNVPQTFTTSPLAPSATLMPVASSSGWPTFPYTAVLGLATSLQEAIYITGVSGLNWTVTRGYAGTIQQNHPVNQTVTLATVGVHFTEFRSHVDATGPVDVSSQSVHGLSNVASNVVVGTQEVQTLTNKTLTTSTSLVSPTITGSVNGPATYSNATLNIPILTNALVSGTIGGVTLPAGPDTVVARTSTDTLTNKTISAGTYSGNQTMGSGTWTGTGSVSEPSLKATGRTGATTNAISLAGGSTAGPPTTGTFTIGDLVWDNTYNGLWLCINSGTPGTWKPVSGKYLISSQNPVGISTVTFASIPQFFTHLRVEYNFKSSNAGGTGVDTFSMQFNGVTTNYNHEYYGFSQGSTTVGVSANTQASMICGVLWSNHFATAGMGRGYIDIPFYTDGVSVKKALFQSGASDGGATATSISGSGAAGGSAVVTAVGSLALLTSSGNFTGNSVVNLYGIV